MAELARYLLNVALADWVRPNLNLRFVAMTYSSISFVPFLTSRQFQVCRVHFSIEVPNEFPSAARYIRRQLAACGHRRHNCQPQSSVIRIGKAARAGQKSPTVGVGICLPKFNSTARSNGTEAIYRFGLSITAFEYCAGFHAQQFTRFRLLAMFSRVKSHAIGLRFLIGCGRHSSPKSSANQAVR